MADALHVAAHDGRSAAARDERGLLRRARSSSPPRPVWRALVVAAAAVLIDPCGAWGANRNRELAEALRKRGWNDTALEFLAWAETSPLASASFAQEAAYQRAAALAAQARQTSQRAERSRLLREAARQFEAFATEHPDETAAVEALREATQLYGAEALAALQQAAPLPAAAAARRDSLAAEARSQFAEGLRVNELLLAACETQIAALPKPVEIAGNPALQQRAERLRSLQAEGRFTAGLLALEQARTLASGSPEQADALDRARKLFAELQKIYPDTLVAATSRYYEGRCLQEAGKHDAALDCYQDLASQPAGNEELRRWASRAHQGRIECLMALGKHAEAVRDGETWLEQARPSEREAAEWLAVAFRLAEAYAARLAEGDLSPAEAKRMQAARRQRLSDAAGTPHELQQPARAALAALGQSADGSDRQASPTAALSTFADAFAAGKASIERLNAAQVAVDLAVDNNPEAVEELRAEVVQQRRQAHEALRKATDLAGSETPPADLFAARYYLSWLLWTDQRWHEAAVVGQFLAERWPEAEQASAAANIALASYEQLYSEARTSNAADGGRYEAAQLARLAEQIARTWPQSPAAAAGARLLVRLALDEGRIDDARDRVERLPEQSRGAAELSLGAALWLQALQASDAAESGPPPDLRREAGEMLRAGYGRLRQASTPPSPALVVSLLYLAQFLLGEGESGAAVEVLDDPAYGPLALAEADSPLIRSPEAAREIRKTALRALLTASPPQTERAAQCLEALEAAAREGSAGQTAADLQRVYVTLGRQLQQQVRDLTAAGRADAARQHAAALETIVERVAAGLDAPDWTLHNWIAQTRLELGAQLDPEAARPYVEQARDDYQEILRIAAEQPRFAPQPDALLAVRKRLADCLRELGEPQRAVEQYVEILRRKPSALELQQAAAEALREWGVATKNLERIEQSIRGAYPQPDGKHLVWGWLQMTRIADAARRRAETGTAAESPRQAARYRDLFFAGSYEVARARRLAADAAPPQDRGRQLAAARQSILSMQQLYPDLGGPPWQQKFHDLLADIEQARP
jgi:hypothetical protein